MLTFEFLLAGYIFCRAVLPLKSRMRWKAVLAAPVVLVAFKFHLLSLIGGPMFFAPELPPAAILISAWLFAVMFIFFFLLVAADLVRLALLVRLLFSGRKLTERFRTVGNRVNLALLAFALVLATCGIAAGTAVPQIRRETAVLPGLPPEYNGFTVAVLADLHADSLTNAARIARMVEIANGLNPDLTVIVGDFVDGTVSARRGDLKPLENLSARFGVFGVSGNHEYYSGYDEWMKYLGSIGVEMLENRHVMLPDGRVAVAGVSDLTASRHGKQPPDIAKALDGIPDGCFKILLAHQPKMAPEAAKAGAGLQISGHTHGGMIVGIDRLVAGFNAGFVSGFYRVGDMGLYVSRGSGIWNGFPIRIGVPAEIVLLTLQSAGPPR